MTRILRPQPLTRDAFAPFGEVIGTDGASHYPINGGNTDRYHALAKAEVGSDGTAILSIFRARPRTLPMPVLLMERHPLGSQSFYPLSGRDWLLIVAKTDAPPTPADLVAFRASGVQGVNYRRNLWHHPLIALEAECDFLVMDRMGPGNNLEEVFYPAGAVMLEG